MFQATNALLDPAIAFFSLFLNVFLLSLVCVLYFWMRSLLRAAGVEHGEDHHRPGQAPYNAGDQHQIVLGCEHPVHTLKPRFSAPLKMPHVTSAGSTFAKVARRQLPPIVERHAT